MDLETSYAFYCGQTERNGLLGLLIRNIRAITNEAVYEIGEGVCEQG